MDDLDRKALYWCLKLSRIAVYNQLFMAPHSAEPRLDPQTALLQKNCLDQASFVMMALGVELGIDD